MYISGQRLNAAFHEMVYSFRFPKSCARYITAQSCVLNKIPSIDKFDQKKIQKKSFNPISYSTKCLMQNFCLNTAVEKDNPDDMNMLSANLYKIWSLYNIVFVISTCFQKKRSWFKVLKLNIVIWREHLWASENANLYPPLCF